MNPKHKATGELLDKDAARVKALAIHRKGWEGVNVRISGTDFSAGFDAGYEAGAADRWRVIERDGLPTEDGTFIWVQPYGHGLIILEYWPQAVSNRYDRFIAWQKIAPYQGGTSNE